MALPYTDLRNEWGLTPDSEGAAASNTAIIEDRVTNSDRALLIPPGLYWVNPTSISAARRIFGINADACELRLATAGSLFSVSAAWVLLERLTLTVKSGVTGATGITGTADRLVLKDVTLDGFDTDGVRYHSAKLAHWDAVLARNCGDGFDLGGGTPDTESSYILGTAESCTVGWRLRTGCPGTFGHLDTLDCTDSHQIDSDGCAELTLAARGTGNGPTITANTGYLIIQSTKTVTRTGTATYVTP